jgi:cardiolipin synthase
MVMDDGLAMVASMNFTRKSFTRTLDAVVLTSDPAVVAGLRRIREADTERVPLPATLSPRLIVAPERARAQLEALISGARSSIRIIDPKLSDPALSGLLRARRVQHLRVETHGAARIDGLKAHGKIMLVDDRLAVIGGLALTALSLDFRREVALVVEEPRAVAVVRDLFARADQSGGDRRPARPVRARSIRARLSERP